MMMTSSQNPDPPTCFINDDSHNEHNDRGNNNDNEDDETRWISCWIDRPIGERIEKNILDFVAWLQGPHADRFPS